LPLEILLRGEESVPVGTSVLGGASGILAKLFSPVVRESGHDNGGGGKYKAQASAGYGKEGGQHHRLEASGWE
jgi:hypothetical protein